MIETKESMVEKKRKQVTKASKIKEEIE